VNSLFIIFIFQDHHAPTPRAAEKKAQNPRHGLEPPMIDPAQNKRITANLPS
jgi:hypothetical protein